MNESLTYIDTTSALADVCRHLQNTQWLAIDTEFERIRTYYPELCLLQVASLEVTALIDPLAIDDLSPLFNVLYDTAITKVFHAARQDLELFFHLQGHVPVPLYDTQLAAPVLGYDTSMGYANLVKAMFDVELPKTQTRTNWKQRPLKEVQLRYAADDVIYLGEMYQYLLQKLPASAMPRLEDEFAALAEPEQYEPDPARMWRKIREARRFKGEQLSVLQQLAAWREITARDENRPRKWILPDAAIIEMARLLPGNASDMAAVRGMDDSLVKRYGHVLLPLIAEAQQKEPQSS